MSLANSTVAQRHGADWLLGASSKRFWQVFERRVVEAKSVSQRHGADAARPLIVLADSNPVDFLAGFFAAAVSPCNVLLANAAWGVLEWRQVFQRFHPQLIWGPLPPVSPNGVRLSSKAIATAESAWQSTQNDLANHAAILIPTGGSSGQLKFVVHTWQTLMASVQGFIQHFALTSVQAYCVLPVYHVSGLMQALRTFTSGGTLALQTFRDLEQGDRIVDCPTGWFLSLVPTQLQRLLNQGQAHQHWLAQFQAVLLGGAPAWPELLSTARTANIPVALTYGMTETAAQIATLHPQDFFAGLINSGRPLPHAQIRVAATDHSARASQIDPGRLAIRAESLGLGLLHTTDTHLHPLVDATGWFYPDDVGFLDQQGYLHIVGRHSHKIISGGENVFPEEVEAAIRATGMVADVGVVGVSDRVWGEAIAALYVPKDDTVSTARLKAALKPQLSRYKQPKRWIAVTALPRNAQGKLNRQHAQHMAATASSQDL